MIMREPSPHHQFERVSTSNFSLWRICGPIVAGTDLTVDSDRDFETLASGFSPSIKVLWISGSGVAIFLDVSSEVSSESCETTCKFHRKHGNAYGYIPRGSFHESAGK
jgi:hypothetical protein